jgi:hypothetical protein
MAWLAKPAAAHDDHARCGSPQVQIRAPARGSFSTWTVSEYVRLLGQTRSGGPAIGTTRIARGLNRSRGRAPPLHARPRAARRSARFNRLTYGYFQNASHQRALARKAARACLQLSKIITEAS